MIKPVVKNDGCTVVFGPCRLSYTHLFQKWSPDGDHASGKYMTTVLIPKGEKETLKALREAVEAAKKKGLLNKWGGKEPRVVDLPLRDGADKENDPDGIFEGCFYLNAKASTRPGVVDKDRAPIMDEDEVYSGMWAVVSVSFYPYDVSGKKGVGVGLNNVMKTKDDERLGGRTSAQSDFAGVLFEDDDDEGWE